MGMSKEARREEQKENLIDLNEHKKKRNCNFANCEKSSLEHNALAQLEILVNLTYNELGLRIRGRQLALV